MICCDDREARSKEQDEKKPQTTSRYGFHIRDGENDSFYSASLTPIFCINSGDHSARFRLPLLFISFAARL